MALGFGAFEILFSAMFCLVFCLIVVTVIRGIGTWHKNNNSPRLVVDAEVVAKRTDVMHHTDANNVPIHHTTYYATFEVRGGERLEFTVTGIEYGQLVEGDRGELTFQGTRYIAFTRK